MEPILKISLMVEVGEIERQTLKEKCGTMAKLSASADKPEVLGKDSIERLIGVISPLVEYLTQSQEKSRGKQTKDEKE
jgi:hypothetical protein